jgi:glycosyltransferase involved in cell wall biosynthesis
MGVPDERHAFLALAVLRGSIPTTQQVRAFTRRWQVEGVGPAIRRLAGRRRATTWLQPSVRVASGVLVDVTDTSTSDFVTGIQRVARETVTRWNRNHDITLVRWEKDGRILRELESEERDRVIGAEPLSGGSAREVIVPFNATFVLPEIAVDRERADRIRSVAQFGCAESVAIGFDCIPITTAETAGEKMPGAFSRYLSALAPFTVIAAISASSAREFAGWKDMLGGAGLAGPEIRVLALPVQAGTASAENVEQVRAQLGLGSDPVVLAVGSHEPRKNHLNVLHAAELCWRTGSEFTLVFAGGNAWKSERFFAAAEELRRRGRRIILLSGVDDSVIWSLYAIARVSVFCSLNEGFGLPLAESLVNRTPAITSNFGSMRELGDGHGALTVDPRKPADIANAMNRILSDRSLHARLVTETATLPRSTWDDYARQLWSILESRGTVNPPTSKTFRKSPTP